MQSRGRDCQRKFLIRSGLPVIVNDGAAAHMITLRSSGVQFDATQQLIYSLYHDQHTSGILSASWHAGEENRPQNAQNFHRLEEQHRSCDEHGERLLLTPEEAAQKPSSVIRGARHL